MTQYMLDKKNNYAWQKIVFANKQRIVYYIDMMNVFHPVSFPRDSRAGGTDCVLIGGNVMENKRRKLIRNANRFYVLADKAKNKHKRFAFLENAQKCLESAKSGFFNALSYWKAGE